MNVLNFCRNNVNTALANETIKIYLFVPQYARGRPLSGWLKWDRRINKYHLSKHFVSCVRFASSNYLLKSYKCNKENVIITFWSYVRNKLGICVRLTLGS